MFAVSSCVQKNFAIWPGKLTLVAAGAGARDALDAGMDMARDLSATVMADAELLARRANDSLPRGRAGRLSLEAAHIFRSAFPDGPLPPLLSAMPGAVCDAVHDAMMETAQAAGGAGFVAASVGNVVAIHRAPGAVVPDDTDIPARLLEFLAALGEGAQGGAALGGARSAIPARGPLDLVIAQSGRAALAGIAAAFIADAGDAPVAQCACVPKDPLVALAWQDIPVTLSPAGLMEPELVWQALSESLRCATAIRGKRLLRAAALGLKGRGRTIGPVDGNRLLRFGVSEWR
ncbi:MAG: hypothetical protein K9G30_03900 [Parvibaculum sp.]|nr:hypothetical protein [Parvibaculum sp.]